MAVNWTEQDEEILATVKSVVEERGDFDAITCDVCGEAEADLYAFRTGPSRYTKALCVECAERSGR